jgi:hypothetical protein
MKVIRTMPKSTRRAFANVYAVARSERADEVAKLKATLNKALVQNFSLRDAMKRLV